MIYEAPNHGSNDKLYLGSMYDYGTFATLDKNHIVALDYYGDHSLVIIDALKNTGIEKLYIDGTSYSSSSFLRQLKSFPGYQGNVSWSKFKSNLKDLYGSSVGNEYYSAFRKQFRKLKVQLKK